VTQVLKKGNFDFSDVRRALQRAMTPMLGGPSDYGPDETTGPERPN
jgi:hypothetical protein